MLLLHILFFFLPKVNSQFQHQTPDAFHEILTRFRSVTATNCASRQGHELFMPMDIISHIPNIKDLYVNPLFPNRTNLAHIHNMALNRAFFYSYLFRKVEDPEEPGMLYFYLSHLADVASSFAINASAIYFDTNSSYPNWYRNYFNRTFPLFGPRAVRGDNFNDPINPQRYSTLFMTDVRDLGVTSSSTSNYTHPLYRINEWFTSWLPDKGEQSDYGKVTFTVHIKYSNGTERNVEFFGPPEAQANPGPIKWTQPYFDCGRSNKWMIAAVSPVADLYPRHTSWRHLQRHKYVAVVVIETDLLKVDINPCPITGGNPAPNWYSGTDRCKEKTTECEPLQGYGLRRTGYQCRCRPGYRLPFWQHGPFQGEMIERATEVEYNKKFDCEKIGNIRVITQLDTREDINRRMQGGYFGPNGGQRPQSYLFGLDISQAPDGYRYPFDPKTSNHSQFYNAFGIPLGKDGRPIVYDENGDPILTQTGQSPLPFDYLPTWTLFNSHVYHGVPGVSVGHIRDPTVIRITRNTDCSAQGKLGVCQVAKTANMEKVTERSSRVRRSSPFRGSLLLNTLRLMRFITPDNCQHFNPDFLKLHENVAYGKERSFKNQAETAVRLAHFISAFNQLVDPSEIFFERTADQPLNDEQLFAEVLANVMGDMRILHSGVYFENSKFPGKIYFAPTAQRTSRDSRAFFAEDEVLHLRNKYRNYLEQDFFKVPKLRWFADPVSRLARFSSRMRIRGDLKGSYSTKYDRFPVQYSAAKSEHGYWSAPFYRCNGKIKEWVLTFSVPFFGMDSIRRNIEFQGVVTVTVPLPEIDINQCPALPDVPNAFKNSDRCDSRSSYCVPILGRRFEVGGYKCECKPGYEYPSSEPVGYFDGQIMESEWEKKIMGMPNKFDALKCRLVGSAGRTHLAVRIIITFWLISIALKN